MEPGILNPGSFLSFYPLNQQGEGIKGGSGKAVYSSLLALSLGVTPLSMSVSPGLKEG